METLTNARPSDAISFYASGNLSSLGTARVQSTRRATWEHDAALVQRAQRLLDERYARTAGLDAGVHCRKYGCAPRVWHVRFASDMPAWDAGGGAVVANLDSWRASGAAVTDSHLHHGRFGVRWKSGDAAITRNRISARYMEISPLQYYMEGPFRLANISVTDNVFAACAARPALYAATQCANATHLPLGYWRKWVAYGGGCGGVCKAASVGASQLDPEACEGVAIEHNRV